MIRLIITGVCGRMGTTILGLAAVDPDVTVTHTLEAKGHHRVGTKIDILGERPASLLVEDDLSSVAADSDVIIDFTEPESSLSHFRTACLHGRAIIIGTTGMPVEALSEMRRTKDARAVISPNMSVGVNLLFSLVQKAAKVLGRDYDAEIVEIHHKWKKDAPSGTAIRLKEAITGADPARDWIEVSGRQGLVGERKADEIGVLSLRGGDIVGEHTVFFAGIGERLEITHRASSRENFARGSLVAAKWIIQQQNGIYDMSDVLGLKDK